MVLVSALRLSKRIPMIRFRKGGVDVENVIAASIVGGASAAVRQEYFDTFYFIFGLTVHPFAGPEIKEPPRYRNPAHNRGLAVAATLLEERNRREGN